MTEPQDIIIAIGTNYDPEVSMFLAKQRLRQLFHDIIFSSEVWTEAVNSPLADKYLNCLACTQSSHGYSQVRQALKQIERKCGMSLAMKNSGYVKIDIDILLFGNAVYHKDDWNRPYVKQLLHELVSTRSNNINNQ